MTDDTPRCARCRKQLAADKPLCQTCETVDACPDIGPAATAAFVADCCGGTACETDAQEGE